MKTQVNEWACMTKTSLITIYLGEVRVAPIKKMTTETCLRIR